MKVAIIHYWFTNWRGGERVVEELLRMYPDADVYAHVADPALVARHLPGVTVKETFIARLPFGRRSFRMYLPLMPMALEELNLQEYDLIISSESGPTKGIIKRPDALHICYCHSPMRYIWDMSYEYRRSLGWLKGTILALAAPFLRIWDVTSAARVDRFVANSTFVSHRIASYYGKESVVIHPPVRTEMSATVTVADSDPYYVVAGELVDYKRVDLAIRAANILRRRLVVVGAGEQRPALEALAGNTVEFVGRVSDDEFRNWLAGARALVFPGLEDFGMVPIEAMAQGTPILAYSRGGSREYLVDGVNGISIPQQTCDSVVTAMLRFEALERNFARETVRATALHFNEDRFRREMGNLVNELLTANVDDAFMDRSRLSRALPATAHHAMNIRFPHFPPSQFPSHSNNAPQIPAVAGIASEAAMQEGAI